jgi:hypothetical protein
MIYRWECVKRYTQSQVWSLLSADTGELVAYIEKNRTKHKNLLHLYYAYIPSFEYGCIGLGGHATLEEAQQWLTRWALEKYGETC